MTDVWVKTIYYVTKIGHVPRKYYTIGQKLMDALAMHFSKTLKGQPTPNLRAIINMSKYLIMCFRGTRRDTLLPELF